MAPLRAFLDAEPLKRLAQEAVCELALEVAESVAGRYQQLAEELLTTVRGHVWKGNWGGVLQGNADRQEGGETGGRQLEAAGRGAADHGV